MTRDFGPYCKKEPDNRLQYVPGLMISVPPASRRRKEKGAEVA